MNSSALRGRTIVELTKVCSLSNESMVFLFVCQSIKVMSTSDEIYFLMVTPMDATECSGVQHLCGNFGRRIKSN